MLSYAADEIGAASAKRAAGLMFTRHRAEDSLSTELHYLVAPPHMELM